jgi:hypothetical protein
MSKTTIKYMIIKGEDTDIRVEDGGIASIYNNGCTGMTTTYYQDRSTDEKVDWEKLHDGNLYTKDWENQYEVTDEMIQDALNWLYLSTEEITLVEVHSFKELMN